MTSRDWYRHVLTGDRAYREERDGVDVIVMDRPNQEITRRFNEHDWITDHETRPLTPMAVAQAAFSADASICKAMGMHQKEDNWLNLRDRQRIAWMKEGPQSSWVRRTLFEYVEEGIGHLAHPEKGRPVSMRALREIVRRVREEADEADPSPFVMELAGLVGDDDEEG